VPPRRNEELLYSHLLHLQAKTERAPIPPTTENVITQKIEAKENSEVHDQRSNRKRVLDKISHPGQTFAAALHSKLPSVKQEDLTCDKAATVASKMSVKFRLQYIHFVSGHIQIRNFCISGNDRA
jgi:hypothetical protein